MADAKRKRGTALGMATLRIAARKAGPGAKFLARGEPAHRVLLAQMKVDHLRLARRSNPTEASMLFERLDACFNRLSFWGIVPQGR